MSDRQTEFVVNNPRDVKGLIQRPSSLKIERQNSGRIPVSYQNFAFLASTDSLELKEPGIKSGKERCEGRKGNNRWVKKK